MTKEKIINEILKRLKEINPAEIIIFGSYVDNNMHENSDIDILVVLNKKGFSKNYEEILENKKMISKRITDLRRIIPIDLLVYTKDEWEYLKNTGSLFIKKIEKDGLRLK